MQDSNSYAAPNAQASDRDAMPPLWAMATSAALHPVVFTLPVLGWMVAAAPINLSLAWHWVAATRPT